MIVFHELRLYWDWAGSNIGAMPGCGIVAVVSAVLFRRPLRRWWDRIKDDFHAGARNELAEIRDLAAKANRIAADTYRHHTGRDHPDAPDREDTEHDAQDG